MAAFSFKLCTHTSPIGPSQESILLLSPLICSSSVYMAYIFMSVTMFGLISGINVIGLHIILISHVATKFLVSSFVLLLTYLHIVSCLDLPYL